MQHHPERLNHGCPTPGPEPLCRPLTATIRPTKKELPVANIKSQLKRIKTNRPAHRAQQGRQERAQAPGSASSARPPTSGDKDAAKDALKVASTKLDKAVSKGVIHQNQAANKKSAMAKKAASL